MKIEINITPDDLANIIVDMKFGRCKSQNVLQSIITNIHTAIEINLEEIDQLQLITDEAMSAGESGENEQ